MLDLDWVDDKRIDPEWTNDRRRKNKNTTKSVSRKKKASIQDLIKHYRVADIEDRRLFVTLMNGVVILSYC